MVYREEREAMKVLKEGRPQKGWAKVYECTGNGNGGGGCGAKLLVEQGDLFHTSQQSYGDISPDYYTGFKCPQCGVLTDIPSHEPPAMSRDLPHYQTWLKNNPDIQRIINVSNDK
jgi:hypothetical protein